MCRSKVTNAGVHPLAKRFPSLESVNLWCCSKVTDAGPGEALPKPRVGELVMALGGDGCGGAGPGGHCPSLESVSLMCCSEVTDAEVQSLAERCPSLESVNLMCCPKVTDAGVYPPEPRVGEPMVVRTRTVTFH
jgi:hypothetical protein